MRNMDSTFKKKKARKKNVDNLKATKGVGTGCSNRVVLIGTR